CPAAHICVSVEVAPRPCVLSGELDSCVACGFDVNICVPADRLGDIGECSDGECCAGLSREQCGQAPNCRYHIQGCATEGQELPADGCYPGQDCGSDADCPSGHSCKLEAAVLPS